MKLWHCFDARSFRALWALEELGMTYELELLDFPPRAREKRIFTVNPLGTVPVLETDQGSMTESSAICEWLAEQQPQSGLGVAVGHPDRPAYLNWLHHADTTLTFPQTIYLRYSYLEEAGRRQPQVADDYRRWFFGRLKLLVSTLESQQFLCANRFTMADICVAYALSLAEDLGIDADLPPLVKDYLARMTGRKGWHRAKTVQVDAAKALGIEPIAPARLIRAAIEKSAG
ncbi:glutathione S-transferase family protein [Sulfitobacter pacificus]|uniref:glutathione S-transferase family protein n=1 Tax=Sulfitobacter pacificus TaxID=1499314 RepID=UPI0024E161AF|nr:glutathione S-transferase family protein [Sulfitobacter pacificus]